MFKLILNAESKKSTNKKMTELGMCRAISVARAQRGRVPKYDSNTPASNTRIQDHPGSIQKPGGSPAGLFLFFPFSFFLVAFPLDRSAACSKIGAVEGGGRPAVPDPALIPVLLFVDRHGIFGVFFSLEIF